MLKIVLYRYVRPDGGVTVSPIKPDCEYVAQWRLISDRGMMLTDGVAITTCTDTDNPSAWSEVEGICNMEYE